MRAQHWLLLKPEHLWADQCPHTDTHRHTHTIGRGRTEATQEKEASVRRKANTCKMRITTARPQALPQAAQTPARPPSIGLGPSLPAVSPLQPSDLTGLPFPSFSKSWANHCLFQPPLLPLILHNRHQGKVKIPGSERSQESRGWGWGGREPG